MMRPGRAVRLCILIPTHVLMYPATEYEIIIDFNKSAKHFYLSNICMFVAAPTHLTCPEII